MCEAQVTSCTSSQSLDSYTNEDGNGGLGTTQGDEIDMGSSLEQEFKGHQFKAIYQPHATNKQNMFNVRRQAQQAELINHSRK